jgi:hypothetical protein
VVFGETSSDAQMKDMANKKKFYACTQQGHKETRAQEMSNWSQSLSVRIWNRKRDEELNGLV